ncbi:MAG: phosphoribosylformylglycinamidine synthase subunit PurQ, partial [Phycisphaerales bacterium]
SYGDDIASGRVLASKLRERLWPALRAAAARGCPMIGACNGFQVMVQIGLLPGPMDGEDWPADRAPAQTCALADNEGARFIDRWVRVEPQAESPCVWTRPLLDADYPAEAMMLPIAHGEGRFVAQSSDVLRALKKGGHVALRYAEDDNPNGSESRIAGICDATGRIFGLMPHPERYTAWTTHPFWTRLDPHDRRGETPGLAMFRAAVEACREPVEAR